MQEIPISYIASGLTLISLCSGDMHNFLSIRHRERFPEPRASPFTDPAWGGPKDWGRGRNTEKVENRHHVCSSNVQPTFE